MTSPAPQKPAIEVAHLRKVYGSGPPEDVPNRDSTLQHGRGEIGGTLGRPATGDATLPRVGITCALCHSTVDNSFAPGIGKRMDGWPNRDLNAAAIIAL